MGSIPRRFNYVIFLKLILFICLYPLILMTRFPCQCLCAVLHFYFSYDDVPKGTSLKIIYMGIGLDESRNISLWILHFLLFSSLGGEWQGVQVDGCFNITLFPSFKPFIVLPFPTTFVIMEVLKTTCWFHVKQELLSVINHFQT